MLLYDMPELEPADLAQNALVNFVRKWNVAHAGYKISSVTFSLVTNDGNLFPTVQNRDVEYRDLYPKRRSISGGK